MTKKLFTYVSPSHHLGKRKYSFFFPLFVSTACLVLLEISVRYLPSPYAAFYAFLFFLLVVMYAAARDGLKGGFIVCLFIIGYISLPTTGSFITSIPPELLAIVGVLYILLTLTIGWLRQTIDRLIEREANEKMRFQTIMQQLPVGVIVTDSTGTIDFANKNADIILDTKIPIGFTVGDTFFVNVVESKPSPPSQSLLDKALTTGKPAIDEEFVILKRNHKKAYIEASATPIRNTRGQIIAAAEILSDVTEQRELERRKDDFINLASHELKTPLTSMKLYLSVMKKQISQGQTSNVQAMLAQVYAQTERLHRLVVDLLDVSRLQTGKLVFRKEAFALHTLIQHTVHELDETCDHTLRMYAVTSPVYVFGDKFRMYQVIANLITNAAKYSPEKGEIIIRMKRETHHVVVSVQDFGIGIAKDQQKKIFDRLYQVAGSKTSAFPGLGMGLYISKEIIKNHNGRIWVESTKGKGSTFFFRLPTV